MSDATLSLLERAPLGSLPPDDAATRFLATLPQSVGDPDLPKRAATLLGYELLQAKERAIALRQALVELKVMPFTAKSVKTYKEAVSRETNRSVSVLKHEFLFGLSCLYYYGFLLAVGPALLGWIVAWQVTAVGAVAALACYLGGKHLDGVEVRLFGRWRMNPLKGYPTAVPQFVLKQAIAIEERCPGTTFLVDEFVRGDSVLDPFLVARAGEEEYYIAVWDEPRFEGLQKL